MRRPRADLLAGGEPAEQLPLEEVLLAPVARGAKFVAASGHGLVVEDALQGIEGGVE